MTGVVDFRTELLDETGAPIDDANPLAVALAGGTQSPLAPYSLNDFEDGDPLYLGKAKSDGTWLVQKYTAAGAMRYANLSNNPGVTTYADAWSGRASLNYALYHSLSGV